MNKYITTKGYQFELIIDESGCIVKIESDDCEDAILNFINKNLPNNINKIPKIKEFIEQMFDEYYKDKI
jgi:hypothetical protein